jgi:hypothetical protein
MSSGSVSHQIGARTVSHAVGAVSSVAMLFANDTLICTIAELIRYSLTRINTDSDAATISSPLTTCPSRDAA